MKYIILYLILTIPNLIHTQSIHQDKMKVLHALTGIWIGTSSIYEDGEIIKQGAAYEHIYYDLDSSILVIQLNSEYLQLHTIINYDTTDSSYYYHPFSKKGHGRYPAQFEDGRLVVQPNDTTRYIFEGTANNGFREYGEKLVNGQWQKTFEDNFKNTQ